MKKDFLLKKLKALTLCLCAFMVMSAQETLIFNEGFEASCSPASDAFHAGCFNNWIATSGTPDNLSSYPGVSAVEGSKYAHAFVENIFECVPFDSRGEGMSIVYAFEQGKMYKLGYHYRREGYVSESKWWLTNGLQNSNSGGGSLCNYLIPDVPIGSQEVFANGGTGGDWVYTEFTFTAGANYNYLWLRPFNPNLGNTGTERGDIYLDDVSLWEIEKNTAVFCDKMEPASAKAWESTLTIVSVEQPGASGTAGDYYLQFTDEYGFSEINNETQFSGDWTQFEGRCICWDYKLFDDDEEDGDDYDVSSLTIYAGDFDNPTLQATFKPNITTNENDDWINICAPIGLCENGQLPAGWMMDVGSGCGDWADLLANVAGISFQPDVVLNNGGGEVFGIDNLCIEDCKDVGCDGLCQIDTDLTACVGERDYGFISLNCPDANFTWTLPPSGPAIEITSVGQSVIVQAGPGIYSVKVEYPNGCSEELSFQIREDCCEEPPAECGTPQGLYCEDRGNGPVLAWSPVSNAVTYVVTITYGAGTDCGCNGPNFDDTFVTSETFLPVPLAPFDCFSWSVQAKCKDGSVSAESVVECYDKDKCPIRAGLIENEKSLKPNEHLLVYPNPAINSFTIKTRARGASKFLVYNTSGTLMYHLEMNESEVVVNAKEIGLLPGIYFIEWTDGVERGQEKLIIQ